MNCDYVIVFDFKVVMDNMVDVGIVIIEVVVGKDD